jgi:hypothetical protein
MKSNRLRVSRPDDTSSSGPTPLARTAARWLVVAAALLGAGSCGGPSGPSSNQRGSLSITSLEIQGTARPTGGYEYTTTVHLQETGGGSVTVISVDVELRSGSTRVGASRSTAEIPVFANATGRSDPLVTVDGSPSNPYAQSATVTVTSRDARGTEGVVSATGEVPPLPAAARNPCAGAAFSPAEQSFPAGGGQGQVTVTASADCRWSARSDSSWLTTSGPSTTGNGSVSYTVASSGTSRRASLVLFEVNAAGEPLDKFGAPAACPTGCVTIIQDVPAAPSGPPEVIEALNDWGNYRTAASSTGRPSLQICMRDNECADGDVIGILINGSMVLQRELFTAPYCQNYAFNVGSNSLGIRAMNGTGYKGACSFVNANTGEISVSALDAQGQVVPGSTTTQKWWMEQGASTSGNVGVTIR